MSQAIDSRLTSGEEYRNIFESVSDGLIIYDIEMDSVIEANPKACEMHGYTRQEFIGLNPNVFMLPESYILFREHVRTAEAGGVTEPLVIHLRRDGSQFYAEVHRSAIKHGGRPCLLSVIRDVSQRIQTEKKLSGLIEARRREQETLLAISYTLASTLELQPGLILDQLQEIIEYNHAALFSLADSNLITLAIRGIGLGAQSEAIRITANSPEILATLFNAHRPIRIANVWNEDPQAKFLRSLLEDGAVVLLEGMQSWLWVPLAVRGRIIGGLGLAHENPNYFTSHHAVLALSVANQAAITMINSELYGQAQALAVLEERQSLARNLHDAVNQSLFSAGLIAEVLPRLWERDQQEARQSLIDLRRLTRGAMAEMRTLLGELRPATLTDSDLGDLLDLLGNALSGRANVPVVVKAKKGVVLPAKVQVAFYRVCQEALYNISKHSKASQVEINLSQKGDVVKLHVRDNGQGFDPEQISAGHYGLGMMRERAEAAGVRLTISSQPGQGTELTLHWTDVEKKESS